MVLILTEYLQQYVIFITGSIQLGMVPYLSQNPPFWPRLLQEQFLQERIKVNGKAGNLGGGVVSIERSKSKISVNSEVPFSKRYVWIKSWFIFWIALLAMWCAEQHHFPFYVVLSDGGTWFVSTVMHVRVIAFSPVQLGSWSLLLLYVMFSMLLPVMGSWHCFVIDVRPLLVLFFAWWTVWSKSMYNIFFEVLLKWLAFEIRSETHKILSLGGLRCTWIEKVKRHG